MKRAPKDPGLQQIDDLERDIVLAHDQKVLSTASQAEVDRFRADVVALAKAVTDQLRTEYFARTPKP